MHLNNEQLLEPDDDDLVHLSQCSECRSRIENLAVIRSHLQSLAEETPRVDQWQEIKRDYQSRSNVTYLVSARKTTVFWQITSIALAASFALFIIWQNFYVTPRAPEFPQNGSFTALIEENNAMQQLLNSQLATQRVLNAKTAGLLIELDIINTNLEQAYLEKRSHEQKLILWRQRQELLRTTLTAIKQPHVIKI